MLFCMALTTADLESLSDEIRRVLKPAALNIYTVRNTTDVHYRTGIHRGEDMWEVGGFLMGRHVGKEFNREGRVFRFLHAAGASSPLVHATAT